MAVVVIHWRFISLDKISFSKHRTCLAKLFQKTILFLDVLLAGAIKVKLAYIANKIRNYTGKYSLKIDVLVISFITTSIPVTLTFLSGLFLDNMVATRLELPWDYNTNRNLK